MAMSQGIKVAIVTKSPQVKVIQAVVSGVFPDCGAYIPVRGHPSNGDLDREYQERARSESASRCTWHRQQEDSSLE